MNRTTKAMMCGVAAMTLAAAVETLADPVSRHNEQGAGVRPRGQWTPPQGKGGFWVPIFGSLPGDGLPLVRNWITDPHEEPAPDEPGDVGGPG